MSEHKDVLASTHTAHGGSGHPQPFVLGKGRRMLRGMELGVMGAWGGGRAVCCAFRWSKQAGVLACTGSCSRSDVQAEQAAPHLALARSLLAWPPAEMARGERALLDIQPSYAFLHKDSGLPLPEGLRREAPVVVDVTVGGARWVGKWAGGARGAN